MSFKDISYLELWWPLCSVERNHLCNFGRWYYEDQCCEIILNLNQWFRRCLKRHFLSGALAALLFSQEEPFVQFGRGYQEEQFCEIILNLDQWFGRRCHLKYFLSGALVALVFSGAKPFMQFWLGVL